MPKLELVFITSPGQGHLVSTVETANLLLTRDDRLTVTILVMKFPKGGDLKDDHNLSISLTPRLRFIDLPNDYDIPVESKTFFYDYINSRIDGVKEIMSDLVKQPDSRLAGLVLDMFCTKFIQVADEFSIPSYVFFTSSAGSLGLFYDVVSLKLEHNQDLTQYKDSDTELSIRCFNQPFPAKLLLSAFFDDDLSNAFVDFFKRIADTKGVLINTFYELEPYAIDSLLTRYNSPKVYPIGPILEVNQDSNNVQLKNDLMNWLDDQPENSVIFLCFGTFGALDPIQVKEFAKALEDSGIRFVWSLRKPAQKGKVQSPSEYNNFEEVLPVGFLEKTAGMGRVIGWAPQVAVLAHGAVGGFVTHCGWNSILESMWHGVPVVTLPLYGEQQTNAFELVRELGIAESIRIDYKIDLRGEAAAEVVPAREIEAAIKRVMTAEGGGIRGKVREMQRKSREVLEEGGSSYGSQIEFIQDVMKNVELK